jgi:thiamine monophosphate kinase
VEAVPLDRAVSFWQGRSGGTLTALHGGEDYQLLFSAPRQAEEVLLQAPASAGASPVRIGEVVRGAGIRLQPGGKTLHPGGFRHFAAGGRSSR